MVFADKVGINEPNNNAKNRHSNATIYGLTNGEWDRIVGLSQVDSLPSQTLGFLVRNLDNEMCWGGVFAW